MSQNEPKNEIKKEEKEKNNSNPPVNKPVYNQELSEEECTKLISIIKSHFIP